MFSLKTAKVIGTPDGEAWSQAHDFKVEGEKLTKRGRLLVVLTLSQAVEGVEAVAAGREVLARINEEYYGNLEGNPFERLQAVLEKLNKEFKNLELILAAFYQKVGYFREAKSSSPRAKRGYYGQLPIVAYFGILGGGKVVIKRESNIQTIFELGSDRRSSNGEIQKILLGSGFIEKADVFLLGSRRFFEEVAEGIWRVALSAGEPEDMVEILAPIVAGREKAGGAAIGIVKVGREIEPLQEETQTDKRIREVAREKAPSVSVLSGTKPIKETITMSLPQKLRRKEDALSSGSSVIRRAFGRLTRFRPKSIFVSHRVNQQKQKKTLLSIAIILIFLLLVSVVLGARKRSIEQRQAEAEKIITQIEVRLEEAKGLAVLKPSEAKKALEEAQKLLKQADELKAKSQELKVLNDEIGTELARTTKEFQSAELPLFLDLSLVKEDTKGDDLDLYKNQLVVLDKEGKRIIGIDIDTRAAEILAGGENLAGASQVAVWDQRTYTLAEKGVLETKADKTNLVIEKSDRWEKVVDLTAWAGSLYLLDSQASTVWRHLVIEGGFGGPQNWFKGTIPDLLKATAFAIDGSIWIAQRDLRTPILKFTSGYQDPFSIAGLEKPLVSPSMIYTSDEANNLYLLDEDNYRVVVLDKEGSYQASYLWTGMDQVEDMVVSEEAKKIFLLSGSKIYEVEIK